MPWIPRKKHDQIESVFRQRMGKMLGLAATNRCHALRARRLGLRRLPQRSAHGGRPLPENICGLVEPFHGRFMHVLFAVLDTSPDCPP